jgi:hypothetical protein
MGFQVLAWKILIKKKLNKKFFPSYQLENSFNIDNIIFIYSFYVEYVLIIIIVCTYFYCIYLLYFNAI